MGPGPVGIGSSESQPKRQVLSRSENHQPVKRLHRSVLASDRAFNGRTSRRIGSLALRGTDTGGRAGHGGGRARNWDMSPCGKIDPPDDFFNQVLRLIGLRVGKDEDLGEDGWRPGAATGEAVGEHGWGYAEFLGELIGGPAEAGRNGSAGAGNGKVIDLVS